MSEPKRGRPRLYDGDPISVRLTADAHDELCREALARRIDVAVVIRERLSTFVSQKPQNQTSLR